MAFTVLCSWRGIGAGLCFCSISTGLDWSGDVGAWRLDLPLALAEMWTLVGKNDEKRGGEEKSADLEDM